MILYCFMFSKRSLLLRVFHSSLTSYFISLLSNVYFNLVKVLYNCYIHFVLYPILSCVSIFDAFWGNLISTNLNGENLSHPLFLTLEIVFLCSNQYKCQVTLRMLQDNVLSKLYSLVFLPTRITLGPIHNYTEPAHHEYLH